MASRRWRDRNPEIPAAGVRSSAEVSGTAECLSGGGAETPDKLRPFRGTYHAEPGTARLNYARQRDGPPRPSGFVYGTRSAGGRGESAGDVMAYPAKSAILADAEDSYEQATFKGPVYRPLGTSGPAARGAYLPPHARDPDYRFGIASDAATSAADLINAPEPPKEDSPGTKALYKKSHRAYAPGEQVRSGLVVPGVPDVYTHRFGARAERSYHEGGVSGALTWTNDVGGGDHTAVLVPEHMAELHARTQPKIGVSRARALVETGQVPDTTFGVVSRTDNIGAGELIHNSLPEELLADDAALGKPMVPPGRPRGTHGTGKVDSNRVYGVPSIRSDVPPPGVRKLDDRQNYGDEKGAWELLNPSPYHPIGVTEDDFLTPLPKAELRDITLSAGIDLTDQAFDAVHAAAAAADPNGLVSIETFRAALDVMRASERASTRRC